MKRIVVLAIVLTALLATTVAAAGPATGLVGRFDLAAPWGVVDEQDVLAIALGVTKAPGTEAPWAWDLNYDGMIDVADVGMVASRVGCTVVEPCYWR